MKISAISPRTQPIKRKNTCPNFKALYYDKDLDASFRTELTPEEIKDLTAKMHLNLKAVADRYPQYAIIIKGGFGSSFYLGIEREDKFSKTGFLEQNKRPDWRHQIIRLDISTNSWSYHFPEKAFTEVLPQEVTKALEYMKDAEREREDILKQFPNLSINAINKALKEKYKKPCSEIEFNIYMASQEMDKEYLRTHPHAQHREIVYSPITGPY